MRITEHSRTAEATAAIRAIHLRYDEPVIFEDPYAINLTSPLWRTICNHRWLHNVVVRGLMRGLRPVSGWILIRDLLTERTLREFVERGHRQFVLLGAGFDSTALRRPAWLHGVRIFEVDHPATQAVKLDRIAELRDPAALPDFETVAVDFECERLADGLARSSFDAHAPALFAWQGVIYYLSAAAIEETLNAIATLAAPGSELMFDFLLPEYALARDDTRVMSLARLVTARMGERYISYHTADDIRALLDAAGFEVIDILLDGQLQTAYLDGRVDGLTAMRGFGIAHARRH